MYQIQMIYKDEKTLNIDVSKDEIQKFFSDINKSQVYIHPETKAGFWTNIQDVRYINIVDKNPDITSNISVEQEEVKTDDET